MKLSELVAYRIFLESFSCENDRWSANTTLNHLLSNIKQGPLPNTEHNDIEEILGTINTQFDLVSTRVKQLQAEVEAEIENRERDLIQDDYKRVGMESNDDAVDFILNRRFRLQEDPDLRGKLTTLNNWKYPGMIIRPGLETFASSMVASDPLYLVDVHSELLGKCEEINNFGSVLKGRLRKIVIKETLDEPILTKIPDGQFGVVLVYNFFNFRPLEYVKKYLAEIYQKLQPGGTILFTINDCDRVPGVQSAEIKFACYTPGKLIKELAVNVGYEYVSSWNYGEPMTYFEFKKPGTLNSLKGGQTLAKVKLKPSVQ